MAEVDAEKTNVLIEDAGDQMSDVSMDDAKGNTVDVMPSKPPISKVCGIY